MAFRSNEARTSTNTSSGNNNCTRRMQNAHRMTLVSGHSHIHTLACNVVSDFERMYTHTVHSTSTFIQIVNQNINISVKALALSLLLFLCRCAIARFVSF